MADNLTQTESILVKLLETVRKCKQSKDEFTNSLSNQPLSLKEGETEIEKQLRLIEIHSKTIESSANFTSAVLQINLLYPQLENLKNNLITEMNNTSQQMKAKFEQVEQVLNNPNNNNNNNYGFHPIKPIQPIPNLQP